MSGTTKNPTCCACHMIERATPSGMRAHATSSPANTTIMPAVPAIARLTCIRPLAAARPTRPSPTSPIATTAGQLAGNPMGTG